MKNVITTTASIMRGPITALSAVDATPIDGAAGNWIKLMPAGTFSGRTGRGPFVTGDQAALGNIVKRSQQRAGGTDIVIDYDHQTVFSAVPGVGGRAPAAGWVKQLEARPDGIFGLVEWTTAAADAIRAGEYRYISPAFSAQTPTSGPVSLIVSAGLTNTPDLDLAPIAASAHATEEQEIEMKSIAKALGLPEDATEADILTAMNALASTSAALVAASGAAKPQDAIAAITAMRSASTTVDVTKYVPIEQVIAMQASITALQETHAKDQAEADVTKAIADGKLIPALKDWAIDLHKKDVTAFSALIEKSPVLTAQQRTATTMTASTDIELTADDLVVMSQMGLSREAMLASKKRIVA